VEYKLVVFSHFHEPLQLSICTSEIMQFKFDILVESKFFLLKMKTSPKLSAHVSAVCHNILHLCFLCFEQIFLATVYFFFSRNLSQL